MKTVYCCMMLVSLCCAVFFGSRPFVQRRQAEYEECPRKLVNDVFLAFGFSILTTALTVVYVGTK